MKYCPECKAELVTNQLDGVERQQCSSAECDFIVWDNPVPVVAGLVFHNDRVVLARNSCWPDKIYSIITGYLERFESPESAIRREVNEELGLNAVRLDFIGHYPFREKNQLLIAYAVKTEGQVRLGPEINDVELLETEQLIKKDFGPLVLTSRIVADWADLFHSRNV